MRFLLGFGVASMLWGALVGALYAKGLLQLGSADAEPVAVVAQPAEDETTRDRRGPRRSRRARAQAGSRAAGDDGRTTPTGEATTGDELDWDGERRIDMAGGEEQLSGSAIEAGFDSVMPRIRRCLVLVPSDGEIAGKLTFGMKVGADGQPRAVTLTGPAVVTSGESGDCLRQAASSIRFPRFSGPDMLFRYPITLH